MMKLTQMNFVAGDGGSLVSSLEERERDADGRIAPTNSPASFVENSLRAMQSASLSRSLAEMAFYFEEDDVALEREVDPGDESPFLAEVNKNGSPILVSQTISKDIRTPLQSAAATKTKDVVKQSSVSPLASPAVSSKTLQPPKPLSREQLDTSMPDPDDDGLEKDVRDYYEGPWLGNPVYNDVNLIPSTQRIGTPIPGSIPRSRPSPLPVNSRKLEALKKLAERGFKPIV